MAYDQCNDIVNINCNNSMFRYFFSELFNQPWSFQQSNTLYKVILDSSPFYVLCNCRLQWTAKIPTAIGRLVSSSQLNIQKPILQILTFLLTTYVTSSQLPRLLGLFSTFQELIVLNFLLGGSFSTFRSQFQIHLYEYNSIRLETIPKSSITYKQQSKFYIRP